MRAIQHHDDEDVGSGEAGSLFLHWSLWLFLPLLLHLHSHPFFLFLIAGALRGRRAAGCSWLLQFSVDDLDHHWAFPGTDVGGL